MARRAPLGRCKVPLRSPITRWRRARSNMPTRRARYAGTCPTLFRRKCWRASRWTAAWAGNGLGSAFLADTMKRKIQAAEIIGIRAVLVHALSEEAAACYERHGSRRSPIQPLTKMMTLKEIVASLL